MKLEDQFKCYIAAYYGVIEMDNYDLKTYILKDIESEIRNFIHLHPILNFNYQKEAEKYQEELSLKTKLQDSLIILNKMDAPMELIFLIKQKLKELDNMV